MIRVPMTDTRTLDGTGLVDRPHRSQLREHVFLVIMHL